MSNLVKLRRVSASVLMTAMVFWTVGCGEHETEARTTGISARAIEDGTAAAELGESGSAHSPYVKVPDDKASDVEALREAGSAHSPYVEVPIDVIPD